jgi:hypothetical protein
MTLRLALIAFASFAFAAITANAAVFPGWERQPDAERMLLISPPDSQQNRVVYVVGKLERVTGNVDAWFKKTIADAYAGGFSLTARTGIRRQGAMLVEVVQLRRNEDGLPTGLLVAAYPVGGLYQAMAMLYPSELTDKDPRVVLALDHISSSHRAGFGLQNPARFDASTPAAPALTARPQAPPEPAGQPAASAGAQGKNCRREPVWGFRMSYFCQPTGICPDRVIKDYETVCD